MRMHAKKKKEEEESRERDEREENFFFLNKIIHLGYIFFDPPEEEPTLNEAIPSHSAFCGLTLCIARTLLAL